MKAAFVVWKTGRALAPLLLLILLVSITSQSLYAQQCTPFAVPQHRFGFNFNRDNHQAIEEFDVARLNSDWYLDYSYTPTPTPPGDLRFVQVIRAGVWQSGNYTATVSNAVSHNPGTLWIVGNEPDRYGQDGLLPEEFAAFYHDLYTLIKEVDASSQVAVGAIVEATPLRLHYLTLMLQAYQSRYGQPLPTDLWTIHAFVLRECNTAGCWGASIPPGMDAFSNEGKLYTVEDHGNFDLVKEHITAFRNWMASNGYRNKPLLITEYGILFPPELGYPYITVSHFMQDSFDYFLNTKDNQIGYPEDEERLVQAWSWFSLNTQPYDPGTELGFNGNLFDPETKQITPLGLDFASYIDHLPAVGVDLGITQVAIEPSVQSLAALQPVTLTLDLRNLGPQRAKQIKIDVRIQAEGSQTSTLVETRDFVNLAGGCRDQLQWSLNLADYVKETGDYQVIFVVHSDDQIPETQLADNQMTRVLSVWSSDVSYRGYLPIVHR